MQQCCFSGKAPVCDGPIHIFIIIMFTAYHFLHLRTLVAMARGLEHLRTFGTDGEGVLMTALQQAFTSAVNLACSSRIHRNIKDKLQELGSPSGLTWQISLGIIRQKPWLMCLWMLQIKKAMLIGCPSWLKSGWKPNKPFWFGMFTEWFQQHIAGSLMRWWSRAFTNLLQYGSPLEHFTLNEVSQSMGNKSQQKKWGASVHHKKHNSW